MMKSKILVTVMSLMFTCLAYAQDGNYSQCYSTHRDKGIAAYNANKYEEAKKHFDSIRNGVCPSADIPANNDLDSWLKKCDKAIAAVEDSYATGKKYYGEENYVEALKWFRKSAEQGHAYGQCFLGYMYDEGLGVRQDYGEAAKWYRRSADQGNADAQCNLGYIYEKGFGRSYEEAVKLYRKSAGQGNARGQYKLGDMYENGKGVTKDVSEAIEWYRKSAGQGNENAKNALKRLGYE